MGKRGPAPKPTKLRVLHGDPKHTINTNEPQPTEGRVVMPATLSPAAKRVWKRLSPGLIKRGLLTEWDRDGFAVYCEAVIAHRLASAVVAKEGILVVGPAGRVKNPALQVARDSAQTIRVFAQEFGLTPSARSSISIPQQDSTEELAAILS